MKSGKSFFLPVGVLAVVLLVFIFRINSDGVFADGSGGDVKASDGGKKKEPKEDASSPDTNEKPLCSERGSKLGN